MKKVLMTALLAIVIVAIAPIPSFAAESKIGTVDFRKILRESKAAKSVGQQLEKSHEKHLKELKASEKSLRAEQEELKKQESVLSPEAFVERKREFQQKFAKATQKMQERKHSLDKAAIQSEKKIQETVIAVTKEIMAAEGLDIVLEASQVIARKDSLDLTNKVLEAVNKKLPKLSVDIKE